MKVSARLLAKWVTEVRKMADVHGCYLVYSIIAVSFLRCILADSPAFWASDHSDWLPCPPVTRLRPIFIIQRSITIQSKCPEKSTVKFRGIKKQNKKPTTWQHDEVTNLMDWTEESLPFLLATHTPGLNARSVLISCICSQILKKQNYKTYQQTINISTNTKVSAYLMCIKALRD